MDECPVPYIDLVAQLRPLRDELEGAIHRVLDQGRFCLGPEVEAFETEFARFCGVQHAIGFNSGTSALHIAMLLLDIGPADEVITTPFTFAATSWAISYVRARPVYVDIDEATFNLDPRLIEKAITSKTKAILPVHLYGHPCDLEPILEIGQKHGLPVVEDAAQAHGATYRKQPVGTFGRLAAFSFYPAKNLGACGEGGALVTNDRSLIHRARSLRDHGSTVQYLHEEVGFNYRMEGIQAAVLRVKLNSLRQWTERRRQIAQRYHHLLAQTPLRLPQEADYATSVYHLYVIRHPQRDRLLRHLEEHQIGCRKHYPIPLHLQKCYAGLGYQPGAFPVAEKTARECLSLPIYPELTDAQIERVATVLKDYFHSQ